SPLPAPAACRPWRSNGRISTRPSAPSWRSSAMPDRLLTLREDLLRAGLAPRHVERYLAELSDHRADIAENLHAAGLAPEAARAEAERRLGAHDALLLPMLADRRFRSPAARWPALFYLLLPLAIQAAIILAGILALLLAA